MEMFNRIVEVLQSENIAFEVRQHEAEGRCEEISKIRGNALSQSLKALVVMAKLNIKDRKYYLVVLSADQSLDMHAIKNYSGASHGVMLAPADRAKAFTCCEMGAVLPFSFHQDLQLIADPSIKKNTEIAFNAGVLDRSIFMNVQDYIKIAKPTFVDIIKKSP